MGVAIYEAVQFIVFKALKWFLNSSSAKLREQNLFEDHLIHISGFLKSPSIWFHVASAGELEMALPVMEELAKKRGYSLLISYYSPSAEPFLKRIPPSISFYAFPFPLDKRKNFKRLLDAVQIDAIFLVRYEFWPAFLTEAYAQKVPVNLISATLAGKKLGFFERFYYRSFFSLISKAFVILEEDVVRFQENFPNLPVILAGDTKWVRCLQKKEIIKNSKTPFLEYIKYLKNKKSCPVIIFGSSHDPELKVLEKLANLNEEFLLIDAPHDMKEVEAHFHVLKKGSVKSVALLKRVEKNLLEENALYEKIEQQDDIVIIDRIGLLDALYSVADIVVIGGGFKGRLHNTLEPSVFGMPVLFGDKVDKYPEAIYLKQTGQAVGFSQAAEMLSFLENFVNHFKKEKVGTFSRQEISGQQQVFSSAVDIILKESILRTHDL